MLKSLKLNAGSSAWWLYPLACCSAVYLGYWVLRAPEIGAAILAGGVVALASLAFVAQSTDDRRFLVRLFLGAVCLRWVVGFFTYNSSFLQGMVGDASTYDAFGNVLCQSWQGTIDPNNPWLQRATSFELSGWGMLYYVAAIYFVVGQNMLASALVTASVGGITAIIVYKVVMILFHHQHIARTAALLIAFSPSMVLWSSYGLKDAPIVLCLSLCALYTLKLRESFSVKNLSLLLIFLFCLYALRHYAFMVLFVAIAGGMILGMKNFSPIRLLYSGAIVLLIAVVFVYFGARDVAVKNFDLKKIQDARAWGAQVAQSGFGGDVDITDTKAAITYLPIGVAYVLLAPFPWMINSLGQLITLPELIIWWLSLPLLIKGYWFALRHRLRESFTICLFTLGLTLIYALYQSNVGTAYRHRAQMYVFFVIFISVGWEMRRTAKLLKQAERDRWYEQVRERYTSEPPAQIA